MQLGEAGHRSYFRMRLLPPHPVSPVFSRLGTSQLLQAVDDSLAVFGRHEPHRKDEDRGRIGAPARDKHVERLLPVGWSAPKQRERLLRKQFGTILCRRR